MWIAAAATLAAQIEAKTQKKHHRLVITQIIDKDPPRMTLEFVIELLGINQSVIGWTKMVEVLYVEVKVALCEMSGRLF